MNSGDQQQQQQPCNSALGFQEQENGKNSGLTIKVASSSLQDFNNGDKGFQEDDEPRTPTSSDQKIPVVTTCPPAPRKPKTAARVNNNKRKTPSFQRISVDLMVMINAVFSPGAGGVVAVPDHILAGDLVADDRGKKVKKVNVTTGS